MRIRKSTASAGQGPARRGVKAPSAGRGERAWPHRWALRVGLAGRMRRAEETQRRYAKLVDASPDAILVWRIDGGIETWNPAAEELFGWSAAEAYGQDPRRLLRSEAPEPWPEIMASIREHGRWDGDLVQQARDGRRLAVSARIRLIEAEDGVERVIEADRAISERKRTEQALRESEERFRDYAIFMLAPDGTVVSWNVGAELLEGYRAEEIIGRSFSCFYTPEDVGAGVPQHELDVAAAQGRVEAMGWRVRRDGSRFWASVVITAVRDEVGCLRGFAKVTRDVTAVERRLSYLASFPEQNPNPIAEVEVVQDGQVLYANPAALRLFPDLREMGTAHPWLEGWRAVAGPVGDGIALPGARVVTVGGRSYHQQLYTLGDEALVRVYGVDITERVQAEEALREANARLIEADRSKDQFLAMLSHELRNPLGPICNSVCVLERTAAGGELEKRARAVIKRQVALMTRLVDDLLDVTRIARGKIRLQRERLDLADVVRRAVEDHRALFVESGLDLREAIPSGSLSVEADRARLAQALGNLLLNAAKFTPPGGEVVVSVEADEAGGQGIVRVRDNGAGITRDMLPRIFEAFTQADTTLERSKGGLGLGLLLVKGVIEMHGGTVSAASEGPGKGAELTVRLPLAVDVAPSVAPAASPPRPARRRVLVIEDNRDAAASLRDVLSLGEHTVEIAYSGPEGIEKARVLRPDLILCDIGLPGMDGYEVARALRADPALRDVTLAALTGYAGPEDVARSTAAGFDVHLAKPPNLERLERLLASLRDPGKR